MTRRDVMLAKPYRLSYVEKWTSPLLMQPKYKGIRCRAIKQDEETIVLLSSQGNEKTQLPHINIQLSNLLRRQPVGTELDGELYVHGASEQSIVGITNRSVNKHEYSSIIQYHIFDYVNEEPQLQRLRRLGDIEIYLSEKLHANIVISPTEYRAINKHTDNIEDIIMEQMEYYCSIGYEGVILRNPVGFYERKRSGNLLKVKPLHTMTCTVIGYEEEKTIHGIYKNSLGALVVRSDEGILFNVGTGLTQIDRKTMWEDRDSLVNKKVIVAYYNISDDGCPKPGVFKKLVSFV